MQLPAHHIPTGISHNWAFGPQGQASNTAHYGVPMQANPMARAAAIAQAHQLQRQQQHQADPMRAVQAMLARLQMQQQEHEHKRRRSQDSGYYSDADSEYDD